MDPGKGVPLLSLDRTSCAEMLKKIDNMASQLGQNCSEIQEMAWQPGVPELAEQMGHTVVAMQSELSKLRDELQALHGRHQKVILENERLRQIVNATNAMGAGASPQMGREDLPGPSGGLTSASVVRAQSAAAMASAAAANAANTPVTPVTTSAGHHHRLSADNVGSGNVCDVCMASFKSRQTLLQHKHIHDPSPRFCCQLCGNKFRQQSGLYQHMRVVHRKN